MHGMRGRQAVDVGQRRAEYYDEVPPDRGQGRQGVEVPDAWPEKDKRSLKLKYLQAIKWDKVGFREQSEEAFQQLGYSNPFFETAVIRSGMFYNEQVENEDVAYDMLLRARQVNPYSVVLAKAYIDQCLKLGLTSYADLTLEQLRELMILEEWKTYNSELEMKKQLLSVGLWRDQ